MHVSLKKEPKDIKHILYSYLKYWYLFVLGLLIATASVFLYLRYHAIPIYQADSVLLIKDSNATNRVSEIESASDLGLFKSSRDLVNEMGILKSSALMEQALKRIGIYASYSLEGNLKDVAVYEKNLPIHLDVDSLNPPKPGGHYVLKFTGEKTYELSTENGRFVPYTFGVPIALGEGSVVVNRNPNIPVDAFKNASLNFSFTDIQAASEYYSSKLAVMPTSEKGGSLLKISLQDPLPERAEELLTTLISIYMEEAVIFNNQLALNTIQIIDSRLMQLTEELSDAEKSVEGYKQRNDLTDVNSDAQMYLESATDSNKQLANYENQLDVLNSISAYIIQSGSELKMIPSTLVVEDPSLQNLILKFNNLQLERQQMLQSTPSTNPLVVRMTGEINALKGNILEALNNVKNGLLITQKNIRSNSQRFQSQIRKVPLAERELTQINRQQSTKNDIYTFLLEKREEAALSLNAPVTNSRIIERPKATRKPVRPNKTSMYLGAFILGIFIPFSGIYVRQKLNDTIQSVEDIVHCTATPVLGKVAHNKERVTVVATAERNTPIAEFFRLIRFNLKFATLGRLSKVILVTSGKKGEGKTFFTINLATSLALAGNKVIALGFDLREPQLMKDLKLLNKKGITDYLSQEVLTLNDIIIPVPDVENFDVIGAGTLASNPGELMISDRIQVLIEELKSNYDYVLIDTAPIGKVADAYGLAPYSDVCIFVVRQQFTSKKELQTIEDIHSNKKIKSPFIVLNDVKMVHGETYGYGKTNRIS
ncbi:GumC family protein [Leeuwenhoekiella polynyae]|uniref:non-specific protein-tyrosine kinase n=1 Tax=Leeuwenhoekiella polynyae TaxID=1550906 RepID=A0A4Q0PFF9_9FLAO|nr:polysaccharide biosynthesis tyrosine autokinase [Leeuwenhoekiella polynyae]RXG25614.1 capsular exopolysaccharide synthesis family protein [Leeuwenhoekiella polynyae]